MRVGFPPLGTRNNFSCVVFRNEKDHEFPRSSRLESHCRTLDVCRGATLLLCPLLDKLLLVPTSLVSVYRELALPRDFNADSSNYPWRERPGVPHPPDDVVIAMPPGSLHCCRASRNSLK